jgi:hypothetical protein
MENVRNARCPTGGSGRDAECIALRSYIVKFAIPQFFFHYTTAYDLMRFKGVQLGKKDFLGFNNPK